MAKTCNVQIDDIESGQLNIFNIDEDIITEASDSPDELVITDKSDSDLDKRTPEICRLEKDNSEQRGFPLWVFPQDIQKFIIEGEQSLGFHQDFLSMAVISAFSSSFGNNYHVKVRNQYTEPAIFWIVIVGDPGTMKTPPVNLALRPIHDVELQYDKEYQHALAESKQNGKGGAGNSPSSLPKEKRTIISDFTKEALILTHSANPKGLLVHVDEIMGWTQSRHGGDKDLSIWNSIWSGTTLKPDRVSYQTAFIERALVNVIGTIQPGLLPTFLTKAWMNSGAFERTIFVYPDTAAVAWSEVDFSDDTMCKWRNILTSLMNKTYEGIPTFIEFSPDGMKILKDWQTGNATAINNCEDPILRSLLSKWVSIVVRSSLVLEVMDSVCQGRDISSIGEKSVKGAIALHKHLMPYSEKVLRVLGKDSKFLRLSQWKKDFLDLIPIEFETNMGIEIASQLGKGERSVYDFLKDTRYFTKIAHGFYRRKS